MGRRGAEELYDLRRDADCMVSLVGEPEYESMRQSLADEMSRRLADEGDPRMKGTEVNVNLLL